MFALEKREEEVTAVSDIKHANNVFRFESIIRYKTQPFVCISLHNANKNGRVAF